MSKLTTQIIGYLAKDAETKEAGNMLAISFSVPHSEKYTKDGQTVENTTWVRCTLWRAKDKAGIVAYLKKGQLVCCEGTPSARGYMKADKAEASLELRVSDLTLLGGKPQANNSDYPKESGLPTQSDPVTIDDLPF